MSRVKNNVQRSRRRKKLLKAAKGFRGGRSKLYVPAKETVERGLAFAYRDRRVKKREFRKLWITRINAGTRLHGLSYSEFIHGLKAADVRVNRRLLSEMAADDPAGFAQLVHTAKQHLAAPAEQHA
ncbi:MAG: 50S ribosomal protein L20 [Gemmatimonadetes bacterium]|nr:50S ribosomal protein L20 [Gemmatimonadota bacterium]